MKRRPFTLDGHPTANASTSGAKEAGDQSRNQFGGGRAARHGRDAVSANDRHPESARTNEDMLTVRSAAISLFNLVYTVLPHRASSLGQLA